MRKKTSNVADFEKAKNTAYMALEVHEIKEFPINMFEVFKEYENLTVLSYKEIMEKTGCTRNEVIWRCGSTEGSISYEAKYDQYIIAYNEEVIPFIRPKKRIYWTLAHEFGHFLLQHNKEKKTARLSRLALNSNDYDKYEQEADFFARYFIAPPSIVKEAKIFDTKKLQSFFGITSSAANKTIDYIKKSVYMGWTLSPPNTLKQQLSDFINKAIYGKTCSKCNSFFYIHNSNFCPYCGSEKIHNLFKGEDVNMKYQGIELNELGRAINCPVCDNESVKGQYCGVCGTYLYNKCTGFNDNDEDFQNRGKIYWHTHDQGCGEILEGNARYCSSCGCTSTFFEEGILKSFNYNPNIDSDDLPF